ncbi:MAG: chain length determinant protein EpsF [Rhizobacter sp.]
MTLSQILVVLRARWRSAFLALAAVVIAVAAASLWRTPQFMATASVVLDVRSPDPIAGVVLPGTNVVGYMATQLGVMQSERVALRALQSLRIDQDPQLRQKWTDATGGLGDFQSWLADLMLRKLDVVPARDSNVITVAYTSPDPVFSAAVANAFVKAYIDTTLELRVEPARQFNSFFDERAKQMREALEQAQAKLSAYEQKKGIVASDERVDVESQRLAELTTQMVVLQGMATDSGSRQSLSGANAERMQEVLNSPLLVGLTTELSRQEGRLNELTSRLGDNHPQVVELRSNVAQLKARIDSDTRRVAGSLAVNNSVNQTRLTQLQASVDEQRSKLLRLKGQRDESSVLLRDVGNAQRAYDMVLTRATQSGVESQTTQTNVSVLKQATPPPLPASPRVLLNILVSVFVGAVLAVGVALARESRDRRLRTNADVIHGLRQPLIGVLPVKAKARAVGSSRRWLTRQSTGAAPQLLSP